MDLVTGLRLVGGAIALGVAVFGAVVLVTGRAPRRTAAAYRSPREAGLWSLCFGGALLLLTLSGELLDRDVDGVALVALAGAVVLVVLATAKFRPRRPPQR